MKIVGLQKLTLLDYPGKVACTVFLNGCNFRCPFCHNYELVEADAESLMEVGELFQFLEGRKGILDGVCITGGEPTIHAQLPEMLRSIREMGYSIKLDTNGYRPQMLKDVVEQGLVDYVAMDIKNGPADYGLTAGIEGLDLKDIEQSIWFLLQDKVDYEFRTTVVEPFHDRKSIEQMAEWLRSVGGETLAKRIFIQPFVDRDTVPAEGLSAPEAVELAAWVEILKPAAQYVGVRGM